MNILVCIKRIALVGSQIVLTADGTQVDTSKLGFQLSPHEENAVEAAVQLVEQHGGEVVLITVDEAGAEEQLRELLAVGADRAIIVESAGDLDPQATAKALAEAARADGTAWDVVVCGTESGDNANAQVAVRLAHLLGMPVVTNVKGLSVDGGVARCERAAGSDREVFTAPLPVVLSVLDGLNSPRYPSVPGRIKARKKPVVTVQATIDAPRLRKRTLSVPEQQGKQAVDLGTGAGAAAQLVEVFKQIGVLQ